MATMYERLKGLAKKPRVTGISGEQRQRPYNVVADEIDAKKTPITGPKGGVVTVDRSQPVFDPLTNKWLEPPTAPGRRTRFESPPEVVAARQLQQEKDDAEKRRKRGRDSTLLTGPQGLMGGSAGVMRKSLIGY